jgi:LysM repeat protein
MRIHKALNFIMTKLGGYLMSLAKTPQRSIPVLKTTMTAALSLTLFISPVMLPQAQQANTYAATVFQLENDLLSSANRYYGTPYQYGADPNQTYTFDCSSYTQRVFSEIGITLPRTSSQQYELGQAVSLQDAKIGDLIFFHENGSGVPSHVGIYAGHSKMINATLSKGVITVDITTSYWQSRFLGIRRIMPERVMLQSGDTLWKISSRAGVSIAQLTAWNQLSQDMLRVGQTLYVSNPDLTAIKGPGTSLDDSVNNIHTVTAGDTLWIIAAKYGISIDQLKQWNQLPNDMIMLGQRLFVEHPVTTYTVQTGDTLWIISQKTGASISAIQTRNQLTSDMLLVGQVLLIPKTF